MVKLLKMSLVKKKLNKIGEFLIGNIMFDSEAGSQAYLIFQPVYRYFKTVTNTNDISSWKSKELSAEGIKPPTASGSSLSPELIYIDDNIRVKFTGSCLKQPKNYIYS